MLILRFCAIIALMLNKLLQYLHPRTYRLIRLGAARSTQQSESSDNAGTDLVVFCLGVTVTPELGCLTEQGSTEPWAVSLPLVCNDLYVETTTLCASAARLRGLDAGVYQMPDITLQTATKVLVQSRSTRQYNVLVSSSSYVNRRGLNHVVDNGGKGCK